MVAIPISSPKSLPIAIEEWPDGTRLYSAGGELVGPSVTTVLDKVHGHGDVPQELWEQAGARGQAVHTAIRLFEDNGHSFSPNRLHPGILPYFEGYLLLKKEHDWQPQATEIPVVSMRYGFGGTADAIGLLDGVPTLPDWKTGVHLGRHRAQTAAYKQAVVEMNLCESPEKLHRGAIYLTPSGGYKIVLHSGEDDWFDFLAGLRLYGRKEAYRGSY